MGKKSKISYEDKKLAVIDCLENKKSVAQIVRDYCVSRRTVLDWIFRYQSLGDVGLLTVSQNSDYSSELKESAVQDYLSGKGSQAEICKKFKIRSRTQLMNWISLYNSHGKLKSSRSGGKIMTKGRNTTFEERIVIVKYCIEHNRNFNEIAEKYQVSYQQVRNWTVKYETYGVDSLVDSRGKRKSEGKLTELERLKAQNKLLEAKNKRLEMENELLKKLEELERGWS